MEFQEFENEFQRLLHQEFEAKSQVLDLLNDFGKIISKNIVPLQFSMKNRLVLFEFAK